MNTTVHARRDTAGTACDAAISATHALGHRRYLTACLAVVVALTLVAVAPAAPGGSDAEADAFFVEKVLPILRADCFKCHGPGMTKPKGGLRMSDLAALLEGGNSGPAIVPGDADRSLLVRAIRWTDSDLEMPPKAQLPDADRLTLERWVTEGAHWPADLALGSGEGAAPTPAPKDTAPPAALPALDDHDARLFFEQEVRPVLADNCFECHGPDLAKVKSGLRLSGRDALLGGGERGPALVPGDPEQSLLIHAVRYSDSDFAMPPKRKLPAASIAVLERWVALGAPWPGGEAGGDGSGVGDSSRHTIDLDEGRTWWSFQPVVRPAVPAAPSGAAIANPIDAFVSARLAAAGLHPNPSATRAELARRAWFDLIGLPPSAEELQAFVDDPSPDAWPKLVDRLLATPQYGERWGRHWLDVVRYAQTNGYERDEEKPLAWRYRDYVIQSLNDDKPYDRFVNEQLAGDELEDSSNEAVLATGFYRIGVWDAEPDDTEQANFDELDDVVRTIGEGFMGVTLGCARCHDHKFDPFSQEDYFSTLAFVRNVRRYSVPVYSGQSPVMTPLNFDRKSYEEWERGRQRLQADLERERSGIDERGRALLIEQRLDQLSPDVRVAWDTPPAKRTPPQQLLVAGVPMQKPDQLDIVSALSRELAHRRFELDALIEQAKNSYVGNFDWALSVKEAGTVAPPTNVHVRGKADSPAQEVPPRFVRVLCPTDEAALPEIPEPAAHSRTTGRRRVLADWIASPEHPLTARVMVNRIWQHHFGRGLVPTPNDFGRTGSPPTDQALLDWLASEFVERGWSIKAMHRLIMGSNAYRMSSQAEDPAALAADAANELLWHQNLRRLDAEVLRDSVLSASGTLNLEPGGRGFFPRLSREALAGGSRPGEGWEISPPEQQNRRSIYAYVKRSLLVPLLEVFDYTSTALPVAERTTTTIASQALMMLNSEFMNEQAAAFAQRVEREAGDDPRRQVRAAFRGALSRDPTASEEALALDALARQTQAFADVKPLLTFRARLPSRVEGSFLGQLEGKDMLYGPSSGWRYLRGGWGNAYNKTEAKDELSGPAALLEEPPLGDVTLATRMQLHAGCEYASLCLRASVDGDDDLDGLEVRFEPAAGSSPGRVRLLLHGKETTTLAEAAAPVTVGQWHAVQVSAQGSRVQVRMDADAAAPPLLDVDAEALPATGAVGLRTWGEALQLDELTVSSGGSVVHVAPDAAGPPARRALESLCLTLLNLNEFVYVD